MIDGTVTVNHQDGNGTWLVALGGEHDVSTTALLARETRDVWDHCTLVVVDLSDTTFIDCSVIHWLLDRRGALAGVGDRPLRIVRGQVGGVAERIFHLLRVDSELLLYPSRRAALDPTSAAAPRMLPEQSDAGSALIR